MEMRPLGATGITVSHYCLGAMMFGAGANEDETECRKMIHRALDAGINFIDTADAYGRGSSETIVGEAVGDRRDRVVLATKVFFPMSDEVNERGGSRRWIVRSCEESLRRLGTDYLDLYQLHRLDPATDPEESLAAMSDLVRAGKVRAIGTSTARAEQIVELQWLSERRALERVRCEQPPYSLFNRRIERDVLPTCERHGMGAIVWGPLNGGWLTGKYQRSAAPARGTRAARSFFRKEWWDFESERAQRKFDLLDALGAIADELGHSLTHVAMAFSHHHPAITSAIIGPRTPAQLEDVLAGEALRLDTETLDRIDALLPPGTDVDPSNAVELNPELAKARRRRSA